MALLSTDRIPSFEGPLDFFLERLRQQETPIAELRLAPLVDEYLGFVRKAGRDLGQQMEWIEMAAVLIRWKSRVLLSSAPETGGHEEEAFRAELIAQLLGRARELAGELAERREREAHTWSSPPDRTIPVRSGQTEIVEEEESFFNAWDVLQQANELRAWVVAYREELRERDRHAYEWAADPTTVEEMGVWATERFQTVAPETWVPADPLFLEAASLPRQCCLFLAFLEQARSGSLRLHQVEEFAPLMLLPVWHGSFAACLMK